MAAIVWRKKRRRISALLLFEVLPFASGFEFDDSLEAQLFLSAVCIIVSNIEHLSLLYPIFKFIYKHCTCLTYLLIPLLVTNCESFVMEAKTHNGPLKVETPISSVILLKAVAIMSNIIDCTARFRLLTLCS